MMMDIEKTDKMFGVVFSDGKGQFCEIGTAVENIKQEFYRGKLLVAFLGSIFRQKNLSNILISLLSSDFLPDLPCCLIFSFDQFYIK